MILSKICPSLGASLPEEERELGEPERGLESAELPDPFSLSSSSEILHRKVENS